MAPPEVDFGKLIGTLVEHEVTFVLIGGLAALVQGSPFPTEDVDVTPERNPENLSRLSAALKALDAKIRTQGVERGLAFDHDAVSLAAAGVWNLTTRYGDLDISFVPNGTDGYADLVREASNTEILGVVVPVASLADIIRSKQAANRPKDQRVLPTLREILANRYLDAK
jgi:hypothetical protein